MGGVFKDVGLGFDQKRAGVRGGGGWGSSICAWKLKILQGDKPDDFGKNAPVYHVYPVSRTTSE